MSPKGLDDFNKRVKRINHPRNKSYYDPELGIHIPKHVSNEKIRRVAKAKKSWVKAWFWSLLIGAMGLMVAQALRFRGLGLVEAGNTALFIDLLFALFIVLTITGALRYRRLRFRVAQACGAAAVLVAGHNLMWYYPDQLAVIYTPEYVQIVRDTTEPASLVFQDVTIKL